MFEIKLALKYLLPKKKTLSSSLISLVSIFVISIVVWLVIVFLSVTSGIEKNWLKKLTSLNAPLRITPTEEYYSSYYYLSDSISSRSNYETKAIKEKLSSNISDPYNPIVDMEIPRHFPKPIYDQNNNFLDPLKKACEILQSKKDIKFQDYEISGALLRITLDRLNSNKINNYQDQKISYLTQMTYLLTLNDQNPNLSSLLITPTDEDHNNLTYQLSKVGSKSNAPYFAYSELGRTILPILEEKYGILLPKSYKKSGVLIGDTGAFAFAATTATSAQEHKIPIYVAGFYDPGVMPIGARCVIVPDAVTRTINKSSKTFSPDGTPVNGIYIWDNDFKNVDNIKAQLQNAFEKENIASFFDISTYKDFEFSKDLLQQFQSDRTLFTLIAVIILIAACSNVISMLILLVNDKKKEIAILRSMGASSRSIASIFGLSGAIVGFLSSIIGTIAAVITLKNLDALVSLLSKIQGHAAFNAAFFGDSLPNELSMTALVFVIVLTPILSIIAGLIPAIKASRIKPSSILRSQ